MIESLWSTAKKKKILFSGYMDEICQISCCYLQQVRFLYLVSYIWYMSCAYNLLSVKTLDIWIPIDLSRKDNIFDAAHYCIKNTLILTVCWLFMYVCKKVSCEANREALATIELSYIMYIKSLRFFICNTTGGRLTWAKTIVILHHHAER